MPALLLEMLDDGRWRLPGEQAIGRVLSWVNEELQFFPTTAQMGKETEDLDRATEEDGLARLFWVARGSAQAEPIELPWLDLDRALLIGASRYSDVTGIALDYCTGAQDPRVIAFGENVIDFHQGGGWALGWRMVAPTFSGFVASLDLAAPAD